MANKYQVLAAIKDHPSFGSQRLSQIVGCHDAFVRVIAARNGIKLPHEPRDWRKGYLTDVEREAALRRWSDGQTGEQIAKALDRSTNTINHIIKRARRQNDARAFRRRPLRMQEERA